MKIIKFIFTSVKNLFIRFFNFGCGVAFYSFLFEIAIRVLHESSLKNKIVECKHKAIKCYLKSKYKYVVTQIINKSYKEEKPKICTENIWVCWWQGEDNLDKLTSCCINSIRRHANGHPVKFISKYNFKDYVDIPIHILNKMNNGIITITHFSDILRMYLLYTYGGLWLDATMYLTKDISNTIFTVPLYSQKGENFGNFVSECQWSGFFIAGRKNAILFDFMKEMFSAYWKNENILIDYYLIDYFIRIGYEEVPEIKKAIDNIPYNNIHLYSLEAVLNDRYDDKLFKEINSNTSFYKLSRKSPHTEYTHDGASTFYHYILNS